MENQAIRLSGEAKDESKMADSMLKDIANLEKNIPSSLKVNVTMCSPPLENEGSLETIMSEFLFCSPIILRGRWTP